MVSLWERRYAPIQPARPRLPERRPSEGRQARSEASARASGGEQAGKARSAFPIEIPHIHPKQGIGRYTPIMSTRPIWGVLIDRLL